MKTAELTGAALDWAVNHAERLTGILAPVNYCGKWEHGGPIIERERIQLRFKTGCYWHFTSPTDTWLASYKGIGECFGPTPLIAAMRCYVASKLGDTVDVPSELLN